MKKVFLAVLSSAFMLVAAGANADLFGTSSASIYGVNPLNGELNFIGTTADGDPNQGSNVKTLQSIAFDPLGNLFGTSSASIYGVNPLTGELNFIGTTADGDPNQGSNVKTLQSIALARNRDGNCANRPFSIRRKRNRAPEGLICSLFRQLANVFFGLRTTAISNMAKMPLYRLEFHAKSQPLDAIMLRNPLNNNNKNRYFLPFWTTLRV